MILYLPTFCNQTPWVHLLLPYLVSSTGKWVWNASFMRVLLPELCDPKMAMLASHEGISFNFSLYFIVSTWIFRIRQSALSLYFVYRLHTFQYSNYISHITSRERELGIYVGLGKIVIIFLGLGFWSLIVQEYVHLKLDSYMEILTLV